VEEQKRQSRELTALYITPMEAGGGNEGGRDDSEVVVVFDSTKKDQLKVKRKVWGME
jgi:hypothetical protein